MNPFFETAIFVALFVVAPRRWMIVSQDVRGLNTSCAAIFDKLSLLAASVAARCADYSSVGHAVCTALT